MPSTNIYEPPICLSALLPKCQVAVPSTNHQSSVVLISPQSDWLPFPGL